MDDPHNRRNLGVLTLWDEAPMDADAVTARRECREQTVPVAAGHYLFAVWDVPDDVENGPEPSPAALPSSELG